MFFGEGDEIARGGYKAEEYSDDDIPYQPDDASPEPEAEPDSDSDAESVEIILTRSPRSSPSKRHRPKHNLEPLGAAAESVPAMVLAHLRADNSCRKDLVYFERAVEELAEKGIVVTKGQIRHIWETRKATRKRKVEMTKQQKQRVKRDAKLERRRKRDAARGGGGDGGGGGKKKGRRKREGRQEGSGE